MSQEKQTSAEPTLKQQHEELVKKIYKFIEENKDLIDETNSKKADSFNLLVKEYSKSLSKRSTVDRNYREWNPDNKTVERFKKYRIRVAETSIFQLNEFYKFLLSRKSDIIVPSRRIPKEKHPLGSETLVSFLRKKSAMIQIPKDLPEDDS
jgi:hypothetical protein